MLSDMRRDNQIPSVLEGDVPACSKGDNERRANRRVRLGRNYRKYIKYQYI
jgi:hypothetical protein